MSLFKLSIDSCIKPEFLETYNKPARSGVNEIRIIEIYQYGSLDVFKSICLTDEELKHILFLLSNNSEINQKIMQQLDSIISTEGIAKPTQINASKKKQMIWTDILLTNDIILTIKDKISALSSIKNVNERPPLEIELTKREIFLMYFVLDTATLLDSYNTRQISESQKELSKENVNKQKKRIDVTTAAKSKLSVFFNPNFQFNKAHLG